MRLPLTGIIKKPSAVFPLFVLTLPLLLMVAMFGWVALNVYEYDDIGFQAMQQRANWLLPGIFVTLVIFVTAWVFILRAFSRSSNLQTNLRRLTSTFEATADGILVVNRNNEIITFNRKFAEMWNLPETLISNKDSREVIKYVLSALKNPEDYLEKIKQSVEQPEAVDYSNLELLDGRVYERYTQPQILDDETVGRVLSFRDITERKLFEETLRESEERFRSIVETTNEWIWAMDLEGNSTYNNPAVQKVLGYSPQEILHTNLLALLHEDDRLKFERVFQTFIARKQGWNNLVHRWKHKDGTIRYLETNAVPIVDVEGRLIGYRGADRDITLRRRTEDALLRSQSALNATHDGVYMFSPDSLRFFYVNQGAIEQTGYSRLELLKMTPLDIRPDVSEKRFRRLLARLINGTLNTYSLRSVFQKRDGTDIPIEIILQYVTSEDGENLFVAMVRDITERHQAQDALQKNLSLLMSTFEATADGILVVDLNNRIVTYNRKYIEIFSIPDEVIDVRDNEKTVNYVLDQLTNAEDFIETTKKLIAHPEIKNHDLLKFKSGKTYERYSHPQIKDGQVVGRVLNFRDITHRTEAEKQLQESQQMLQLVMDTIPQAIWWKDRESRFIGSNRYMAQVAGFNSPEEIVGLTDYEMPWTRAEADFYREGDQRVMDSGVAELNRVEPQMQADGKQAWLNTSKAPLRNAAGEIIGVLGTFADITDQKRADAALRESEHKFRTLLGSMSEGLLQVDSDDCIQFVNNCLCEMVGYSQDELIGTNWTELLLDEERDSIKKVNARRRQGISDRYEIHLKKKSGETLWVIVGGAPVLDSEGAVIGSMGVFTDISERKRAEEKLVHDAFHDDLTGLANRTLFTNHLQMTIERGKRSNQAQYAVLFLDFDRFKVINDSLGHAEGDNLLKQIARRLELSLRTGDLLARLGGDEFTILLNELADIDDAIQVAERIQNDLNIPFMLGEQEVFMSASIGIALSSAGHYKAEDMLRDADIAMYRAKSKGKAQHQVFEDSMHKYAINKLQLETEMHHALQRGEFCLYYQPIINLETNQLKGFEALIRWEHPERGVVSPSDFILAAEENGLIVPLGRWILYESCRQMREWQNSNPLAAALSVSVNLSTKQFSQFDLYEQVAAALISTQLDPRCLKLEITESQVMENSEKAVSMMNRIRETGVELSLDDFGTGYSSLSYLHRLPVNYLKIDRSFVSRMVESRENGEIVRTIVKLAQNLKMKVIAEGIESAAQFAQLKQLGCEYGQGYYFSRPLDVNAAVSFINSQAENTVTLIDQPIINAELNM